MLGERLLFAKHFGICAVVTRSAMLEASDVEIGRRAAESTQHTRESGSQKLGDETIGELVAARKLPAQARAASPLGEMEISALEHEREKLTRLTDRVAQVGHVREE